MRLTLRTLLAHLDRTLDPEDDAIIAAKLRESEFATKLAERVRACLSSNTLGSPSPQAAGPADDPNRIGEYLDSVLAPEQVAEVERICLESDAHLAEVAACHQILTLVLAKPAEASQTLRNRLHELRPETPPTAAASGATLAEPAAPGLKTTSPATVVAAGSTASGRPTEVAAPPILPVGPDDSGVSDAPTRLKAEGIMPAASREEPAIAGSKKLSPADFSDYSGRPSRVVPWLVSLALIAAFLFVASQAFAPLLQRRAAEDDRLLTLGGSDSGAAVQPDEEPEPAPPVPAAEQPQPAAPPAPASGASGGEPANAPEPAGTEPAGTEPAGAEPLAPTPPLPAPPAVVDLPPEPAPPQAAGDAPGAAPAAPASPAPMAPAGDAAPPLAVVEEVPAGDAPAAADGNTPVEPATAAAPAVADAPATGTPATSAPPSDTPSTDVVMTPPAPAEVMPTEGADAPAVEEPIVISSEGTLLLTRDADSDTWTLGEHDDVVPSGTELIGPPLYRNRLSLHQQVELTLIGPARATVLDAPEATDVTAELVLDYGRFLLTGMGEQPHQVSIRFEDTDSVLTLPTSDSAAAIEVRALRPAGMDPENAAATQRVIQVLAASGTPRWRSGNRPEVTLEPGQLLTLGSGNQISLTGARAIPDWLDPPAENSASLEASARSGLLELVRDGEAIELALREAINFRRSEVAALAAQTLLQLGRHDVYFGSEGIFSQVRQRNNWPDHFNAMLNTINRGPESAAAVREAIERMDAAQATEIYRLLWLFSDRQLEAGGDQTLVAALDSPNMTLRVLAAENLRHITGNTLLYKPEVETPSRRSSDIKKWETRLRRGEIRWAAPRQPAAAAPETPPEDDAP